MRTDPVNTVRIFRTMPPSARWGQNTAYKPTIQLDEEQAITVRKVNTTAHLALQDDQLVPERGIL